MENHLHNLNQKDIKRFLEIYQTNDNLLNGFNKILCFYFSIEKNNIKFNISNDNLNLSIDLLYNRLLLSNNSTRSKDKLIDYYIKQTKLEQIDVTSISSEKTMGNLLEIAIVVKIITGKGLYLPEIEKEQYLSSFTEEIFKEKCLKILRNSDIIVFKGITIKYWMIILAFFLIESFIFGFSYLIESFQIPFTGINIDIKNIENIPIWIILIFNGIIMVLFMILNNRRILKNISDEKWK